MAESVVGDIPTFAKVKKGKRAAFISAKKELTDSRREV
jgi:hypothetical protein